MREVFKCILGNARKQIKQILALVAYSTRPSYVYSLSKVQLRSELSQLILITIHRAFQIESILVF